MREKKKRTKLFGRRMKKRMAALIMAAVMLFSCVSGAVPPTPAVAADTPAAETPAGTGTKVKTFVKNTTTKSLKAYGKHIVSSTLSFVADEIDEATGSQVASKIVSWVRTYVMGEGVGMKLAAIDKKLNQIIDLCNQILDKLDDIENEIRASTTLTTQMLANQNIADASRNLSVAWETARQPKDMPIGVRNALDDFKTYMQTAQNYKNGTKVNNKAVTEEDVKAAENLYVNDLWSVYVSTSGSDAKKQNQMYEDYVVSNQIEQGLKAMISELYNKNGDPTYTDYAAQYAYMTMAFTGDQYEFISQCMDRQLMEICFIELMWQDFLGRISEYLADNYEEDDDAWEIFRTELQYFGQRNQKFAEAAEKRMTGDIYYSPIDRYATITLSKYLTDRDEVDAGWYYRDDLEPVLQYIRVAQPLVEEFYSSKDDNNTCIAGLDLPRWRMNEVEEYDSGNYKDPAQFAYKHTTAYYSGVGYGAGALSPAIQKAVLRLDGTFSTYLLAVDDYNGINGMLEDMNGTTYDHADHQYARHYSPDYEFSFFNTNAYIAGGSTPQNYWKSDEEFSDAFDTYFRIRKSNSTDITRKIFPPTLYVVAKKAHTAGNVNHIQGMVDMTVEQPINNMNLETTEVSDDPHDYIDESNKVGFYTALTASDHTQIRVRQSTEFPDSEDAYSKKVLYRETPLCGDTFKLHFPKKTEDGKVPVSVNLKTRGYYDDENSKKDELTDVEFAFNAAEENLLDYDELQSLIAESPDDEDEIEITYPVPYAAYAVYDVDYDYPVGDVKNLQVSGNPWNNEVTVSFDKIEHASQAKIYISTDKNFVENVETKVADMEKLEGTTFKASYTPPASMIGERIYVMVQGEDTRSYRQTKNPGIWYGTSSTYYTAPDAWYGEGEGEPNERKFADYTLYGGEVTVRCPLTPVVDAAMVSAEGDVEVTLSRTGEDVGSYQIQVTDVNTFPADRLIEKTIDGELTATFRLESNRYYYIRAREQLVDAGGNTIYSDWSSNVCSIYTGISYDNIEKIEVLDPPTSVRVTAEQSQDPLCEGYRFVAYSEDVLEGDVMEWFSAEVPEIDERHKDDVKYKEISKTEELVCVFEDLSLENWHFFVEIYSSDENGRHIYSNKTKEGIDIAEVNLRPHVKINEIELTDVDELTVSCSGDYTSTNWKVQIIELANGNRVCAEEMSSTDNRTMTVKVPRKNNLEVRVTSWREDPDTGETVEGKYKSPSGNAYDSQTLDLALIPFFNVVGDGWIRAKFGKMTGYTAFEYELYQGDTLLKSGEVYPADEPLTTEPMGVETVLDFKNLSEGKYRLAVKPYVKKTLKKEYGEGQEISLNYGPPEFEGAILLDPLEKTDWWGRNAYMPLAFLASTGEAGDLMPDHVMIEVGGPKSSFPAADNIYDPMGNIPYETTISVSYNETYKCFAGKVEVYPENTIKFAMSSCWKSLDGTKWIYSKTTSKQSIDLENTPKYSDFSEWLESHMDEVSVDIVEDTSSGLKQVPKAGEQKQKMADSGSKKKYLVTVSLPENMELEGGGKLDFDGITVRLTNDKEGQNVIATGYEKGRELIISELSDGNVLEEGKSYYVWISPFNYGDKEEKIRLNAGYAGPYEVNTSPLNTDASGQPTPTAVPTSTATPAPASEPTPEPVTATPKPADGGKASGLGIGRTATAGSGATKARYKATGKNTVTYQKAKGKKSAKKLTVPATVKINGKKYKVTKIASSAFKGYKKLKTVVIKPKGLKEKKITGCFKGTSVETVYAPKKQYKKYKKFFTKKVTKSKVKVKVKKKK